MASFAMLPILSGFMFDMPKKKIGFNPIINEENFCSFWSLDMGWGKVNITKDKVELKVLEGSVELMEFAVPFAKDIKSFMIDDNEVSFLYQDGSIYFDLCDISDEIIVQYIR